MIPLLLAHHVELYHIPVLALLSLAGFYVGWRFGGLMFINSTRRASRVHS